MEKLYYIYIIRTQNNSLYTGISTDVKRRITEHNASPKGAKFIKAFKIVKIELILECLGRSNASKIEWYIKQLPKQKKEMFLKSPLEFLEKISEYLNISTKISTLN